MRQSLLLYSFLVAAVTAYTPDKQPDPADCKYDTGRGASFDLSTLEQLTAEKPITITDSIQESQMDYTYTFGICNTIAPPEMCLEANGESRVTPYWAPAWQTNSTQDKYNTPIIDKRHCAYLGGNGDGHLASDMKWSMLDESNPAAGVKLTYINGQHCNHRTQRREMVLNLKCSKKVEKVEKTVMDESSHCVYEVTIESEYACPLECGFGGHQLCSNHGVCGYDSDLKAARCFCNDGFSGDGCQDSGPKQEESNNYGPILGLLIFVTIALVGLAAAVVGLWRYMHQRTLPLDGQSYAALGDDSSNAFQPSRMSVSASDF